MNAQDLYVKRVYYIYTVPGAFFLLLQETTHIPGRDARCPAPGALPLFLFCPVAGAWRKTV